MKKNLQERFQQRRFSIARNIIFILVFLVVPFSWGSFLISGGDYFHIVFPAKQISHSLYLWDYRGLAGSPSPNNACAVFPFLSFLFVFDFLKFTPQLSERIWIIFILFSQFFSMYYLLNSLDIRSQNAKFISSIFYAINPVNTLFLITPPIAIGIVLMPLTLGLLINGIIKKSTVYFVILVIVSFVCSYIAANPAVFVSVWVPFIFYIIANFSKIKKSHLFLLFSGLLLVNIYWIFNVISIIKDVGFEHGTSWTAWTTANSSFLNMFRFQGFWAWNAKAFGSLYFPHKVFYENPMLIFVSFCIISIAFFIFINTKELSKTKRSNLYIFALLFLISMFIAKGLHEPLSFLNRFAYKNIPFFWIFRSPWSKFMPIVVFSLIVLFCYSSEFIEKKVFLIRNGGEKSIGPKILNLTFALLIFIFSGPYFTGGIIPGDRGNYPGNRIKVPNYWYRASEVINNQAGNGKILLLPENPFYQMHYFWPEDGYYGIDPTPHFIFKPLISMNLGGGFVGNSSSEFLKLLYEKIAKETTGNLIAYLKIANVRYILHRNDLDWTHLGEGKNSSRVEPEKIKKMIENLPFNLEKSFGTIKSKEIENDQYFKENILKIYPYMKDKTALDLYKVEDNYFLPQIYASQ